MTQIKPLNWRPQQGIQYTVVRRPDGGMHFTFIGLDRATLEHWRAFSLAHLHESDRLTRNLYDLRAITEMPEESIRFAVDTNSDPAARNIRLAVVVAGESVLEALEKVAALTPTPGGVEMKVFLDLDEAERWLARPLDLLV